MQKNSKMINTWRLGYLLPVFTNKGDVSKCVKYLGIKLTAHTLKIFECIIKRLTNLTEIITNHWIYQSLVNHGHHP